MIPGDGGGGVANCAARIQNSPVVADEVGDDALASELARVAAIGDRISCDVIDCVCKPFINSMLSLLLPPTSSVLPFGMDDADDAIVVGVGAVVVAAVVSPSLLP